MNIGIYKFYKDLYINSELKNSAEHGYSAMLATEVWNFIDVLKERNTNVTVLSSYKGQYALDNMQNEKFDKIIVFSGKFSKDKYGEKVFKTLKKMTDELIYIVIDIRNEPKTNVYKYVDKLYAVSFMPYGRMFYAKKVDSLSAVYAAFHIYENIFTPYEEQKTNLFYYDTNDTDDRKYREILEFIYRPGFVFYIRNAKNIPSGFASFNTHFEYLKKSKFSFATNLEKLYRYGLVSGRIYENIIFGMLTFTTPEYDKHKLEINDNELKVRNFSEMLEKMNYSDEWRINKVRELKQQAKEVVKKTKEKILQMTD